jgi:ADP-L-glycero-D-manno-heptose 6-epimerase
LIQRRNPKRNPKRSLSVNLIVNVAVNRVLVTGADGFIGRNLCTYLEARGLIVTKFDTNLGDKGFPEIINQDYVIHLGANSNTTETDWAKVVKENFAYSAELYKRCEGYGVDFQYASSASVYGAAKTFNEDDFCKPLSPYAFSKYMLDCWLTTQRHPYVGFRYFNVYGLGEDAKGDQASPVSKFIKQAKENGEIKLFKNSDKYKRDFVSVEDVCKAHFMMLSKSKSNCISGVFNVGTGNILSFKEIAEAVKNKFNCKIKEIPMPKELIGQYQKATKAENKKLIDAIGEIEWNSVIKYIEEYDDVFLN